jgi:hypothetical protein
MPTSQWAGVDCFGGTFRPAGGLQDVRFLIWCAAPSARLPRGRSGPPPGAHLAQHPGRAEVSPTVLPYPSSRPGLIRLAREAGHRQPRASSPGATTAKQPGHFSTTHAASPIVIEHLKPIHPDPADDRVRRGGHGMGWTDRGGPGRPEHPILTGYPVMAPAGAARHRPCRAQAPSIGKSGASSEILRLSIPPHFSARASGPAHRRSGGCERSRALIDTSEMMEGGTRT